MGSRNRDIKVTQTTQASREAQFKAKKPDDTRVSRKTTSGWAKTNRGNKDIEWQKVTEGAEKQSGHKHSEFT